MAMLLYTAAAALAAVLLIILIRTFACRTAAQSENHIEIPPADVDAATQHLAEAVRFPTISGSGGVPVNPEAFRDFHSWLSDTYPLVHRNLERVIIADYTLLYIWKAADPALEPILLTAHQDVVPPGDPDSWTHPPFSGTLSEGFVWGRGTLDVKIQIVGILEAVETLLRHGSVPRRGIHICFGHDEEVGGYSGAAAAAAYLERRQVRYAMVLDEGGAVTTNMMPGLSRPAATFGVAEKGYMDLEISSSVSGGHASMPGSHTSLSRVAEALSRLQKHPMPARLTPTVHRMFRTLAPGMPFSQRLLLANLWLFKPLFFHLMRRVPAVNAMIRTTAAATMASGSSAPNVLPERASAVVNLRLLHGESSEAVRGRIEKLLGEDVELTVLRSDEPSAVSSTDGKAAALLTHTIGQIFPDAIITGYLMAGSTDARKYERHSDAVYRFSPLLLDRSELSRMHNSDERVSIENIGRSVSFYLALILRIEESGEL